MFLKLHIWSYVIHIRHVHSTCILWPNLICVTLQWVTSKLGSNFERRSPNDPKMPLTCSRSKVPICILPRPPYVNIFVPIPTRRALFELQSNWEKRALNGPKMPVKCTLYPPPPHTHTQSPMEAQILLHFALWRAVFQLQQFSAVVQPIYIKMCMEWHEVKCTLMYPVAGIVIYYITLR